MAKQNRQDDAYNLRRVFEEMELDLVRSLRRNLKRKRHEQEEKKRRFSLGDVAKGKAAESTKISKRK